MCILFRNAHAITKHARPYTDFVWMRPLDKVKCLPIGRTYQNDKQCAKFIHHIAQARRCVISEIVDKVKFISLICDGSTDSSRTEAALEFIRCCHKDAISVHFVGVKNVAKGDAHGIEVAISTLFTEYFGGPTWERKLVGTDTDGASNMLSKNNGFVARLRARLNRRNSLLCTGLHTGMSWCTRMAPAVSSCMKRLIRCSSPCTSSTGTVHSTEATSRKHSLR